MIKAIALAAKRADLSVDEFHNHWRKVHGPLVPGIKLIKQYVQSHRLPQAIAGFDNVPYNGVAEIWFDSLAAMHSLPDDPDYIAGARRDEPNFVDMDKLKFFATREHVFIDDIKIDQNTKLVKAIFLLHRRPDMTVAQYQDYWINGHAPQIPRDAGIVRYVQSHTLPETYASETPTYDGVAELSFADLASFNAYWNSPRIQAIFAADAPKFLDGARCTAFLADENRVIWN